MSRGSVNYAGSTRVRPIISSPVTLLFNSVNSELATSSGFQSQKRDNLFLTKGLFAFANNIFELFLHLGIALVDVPQDSLVE
jgi:hypothetical protein